MLWSDSSLFLRLPGWEMIMFVVIKQSLFDQELSDTECVQVAACQWCWTGAQTQKLPRLLQSLPSFLSWSWLRTNNCLSGDFLALHHRHHWERQTCNYAAPVTAPDLPHIYLALPHFTSSLKPPSPGWSSKHKMGPDFISSSLTVIFPN